MLNTVQSLEAKKLDIAYSLDQRAYVLYLNPVENRLLRARPRPVSILYQKNGPILTKLPHLWIPCWLLRFGNVMYLEKTVFLKFCPDLYTVYLLWCRVIGILRAGPVADLKNLGMPEVFIARSLEGTGLASVRGKIFFFVLISYLNLISKTINLGKR